MERLWSFPDQGETELLDIFEAIVGLVQSMPDGPETLSTMRLINHSWRNAIDASLTTLTPTKRIAEPALSQLLSRFKKIEEINPPDPATSGENRMVLQVSDATLPALQGLTRLRTLGLGVLVSSARFCADVAPLGASLTALSYYGGGSVRRRNTSLRQAFGLDDEAARVIGANLRGLRSLDISRCAEMGAGVAAFSALTGLQSLRLYELEQLNNSNLLAATGTLSRLTALTISMCGKISDGAAPALKRLTPLERLDFSQNGRITDVTDATTEALADSTRLQSLILSSCQVTLQKLPRLQQLTHLEVAETEVDDEGLQAAAPKLPLLQRLSIADCQQVTDVGLHALRLLPRLESLNMRSCYGVIPRDVAAWSLDALSYLTGLTSLKADYLFFDRLPHFIARLAPLTALQVLMLDDLQTWDDDDLSALCGMRQLRQLRLPGLPLTEAEVQRLRKALPNLEPNGLIVNAAQDIMQWVAAMDANSAEASNDDEDEMSWVNTMLR